MFLLGIGTRGNTRGNTEGMEFELVTSFFEKQVLKSLSTKQLKSYRAGKKSSLSRGCVASFCYSSYLTYD